jgi:D-serine deaminase-like pyridoxal phosphate-dependent protein
MSAWRASFEDPELQWVHLTVAVLQRQECAVETGKPWRASLSMGHGNPFSGVVTEYDARHIAATEDPQTLRTGALHSWLAAAAAEAARATIWRG